MNPLKTKVEAGKTVLGFLVTIPNPQFAAMMARTGADWMMIDMEHGPIDIASAQSIITATAGTECTPIVRVPVIDPVPVKQVLDSGAFGVIFPTVTTREEAELAVQSMRYPPEGIRGVGPIHAAVRWGLTMGDYIQQANEHLLTIVLIEHIKAVENIDAILAVPGIDVAMIAPFDFSASMGLIGQLDHPEVAAAIAKAEKAILKSDAALGGLGQSPENTNAMIEKGYTFFVLTHDGALIDSAVAAFLDNIKR